MATEQSERPSLPAGTYYITAMLIGGERIQAQSMRLMWDQAMSAAQLTSVAFSNADALIPDDLAGAEPGMWWLVQVMVFDAWGRTAIMSDQAVVDRSLHRDELAGELARILPEAMTTIGEGLLKLLTAVRPTTPEPLAVRPALLN